MDRTSEQGPPAIGLDIPILENSQSGWEWSAALAITHYPWDVNGYRPKVECRIYSTFEELQIKFISYESQIRAQETMLNGEVYKDSCVEFFFQPAPDRDSRYFNFEINPIGTMLVGLGSSRFDRTRITVENYKSLFDIQTSVQANAAYTSEYWEVTYRIPFSWIRSYFHDFSISDGYQMRGNFYKCADGFEYPHYGCWNEIRNEKPDFHLSQFFGPLQFNIAK